MVRLKLLIVEDEPILTSQVAYFFDAYPELDILTAKTGEEAMEIIHKERPEIIILDLKLGDYPAMDGMGVLERLRKFDVFAEVIVMTALQDDSFEIGALRLGARLYLRKPFDVNLMIADIDQIIKERQVKK